jgi:hypothetical protein
LHQLRNNSFSIETGEQEHTNDVLYFLEILELYKLLLLLKEDLILKEIPNKVLTKTTLNSSLHEKDIVDFQE